MYFELYRISQRFHPASKCYGDVNDIRHRNVSLGTLNTINFKFLPASLQPQQASRVTVSSLLSMNHDRSFL
jgi:hypothetical protein